MESDAAHNSSHGETVQLLEVPDLPNALFVRKWAGLYEVLLLETKY